MLIFFNPIRMRKIITIAIAINIGKYRKEVIPKIKQRTLRARTL